MATVVSSTIGVGGDYSTPQAWENACPSNLVTLDQIWEGRLISSFLNVPSSSVFLTFSDVVTDTTRFIRLTVDAGLSFVDNPAASSVPLAYNEANGIAVSRDGNNTANMFAVAAVQSNVYIERLQAIQYRGSSNNSTIFGGNANVSESLTLSQCIVDADANYSPLARASATNCLIVQRGSGQATYNQSTLFKFKFVTFAKPAGASQQYPTIGGSHVSGSILEDCAIFGYGSVLENTSPAIAISNCYTNSSQALAGFTQIPYDTTTGSGFENIDSATLDYRLKSTSGLIGVGIYDLDVEVDITDTPRGDPPDVGCWEYVAGGVVDHAADGDVTGNTADVTGEAVLTEPATVHQATGAVAGLTSTVMGTAKRFLLHTTSGDVVDSTDATVTGQAELINAVYLHETEGVLTGQLGTVAGTARRFRTHPTDGILLGDLAAVVGLAEIVSPPGVHETDGTLTGQRGTVAGTAKLQKKHTTTGALAGRTAVVTGDAIKFAEHDASGIIVGYDAKVVGQATNVGSLTLTPADIAAIVAALKAEILPVNIVRVNHIDVDGTGADSDPWGPV